MKANAERQKSDWAKVGPYLYRGTAYYAPFKLGGKQIRRSLKTGDLDLLAARCLETVRLMLKDWPKEAPHGVDVQMVSHWQGHVDGGAHIPGTKF